MAEGWLWLSMRMATAIPSPASITPAFSPGPDKHVRDPRSGVAEMNPRRLVRAVLAPHHRKQRQFEMVGGAAQDRLHLVALTVGESECAVKRSPAPSTVSVLPGTDGRTPVERTAETTPSGFHPRSG